jgi:hypothetical protein
MLFSCHFHIFAAGKADIDTIIFDYFTPLITPLFSFSLFDVFISLILFRFCHLLRLFIALLIFLFSQFCFSAPPMPVFFVTSPDFQLAFSAAADSAITPRRCSPFHCLPSEASVADVFAG